MKQTPTHPTIALDFVERNVEVDLELFASRVIDGNRVFSPNGQKVVQLGNEEDDHQKGGDQGHYV